MITKTLHGSIHDYINAQVTKRHHTFEDFTGLMERIRCDRSLEGAFVGSYSVTARDCSFTVVSNQHTWCGLPVSASSIARHIIQGGLRKLGRKRVLWSKLSWDMIKLKQPMYCDPVPWSDYLIYVDIRACYHTIYSRIPFDLRFTGLRPYDGEVWFKDFLPPDLADYKDCRNSVIGVMRSLKQTRVVQGKLQAKPHTNVLLNPQVWGYIVHLLHTVAHRAVDCNAVYFNTDGAIFRTETDAINWMSIVSEWGFEPVVKKQGPGYVSSVGNYWIDTNLSGRIDVRRIAHSNLFEPSPYVLQRWLKWQ